MAKISTYTNIGLAILTDDLYVVDDPAGSPVSNTIPIGHLAGLINPGIQGFRLTLETGVPVSTTDQLAKSIVYATPFLHNAIPLWDGSRWVQFQVSEFSVTLAGLTSGKNYDVIAYIKAGVPALDLIPAWTNDTTRASAISRLSGVYTNTGTITSVINGDSLTGGKARVLGTLRTTGTTTTADSGGLAGTTQVGATRFLWNLDKLARVWRPMQVIDTTDTWTYTTASFRQVNAASGNRIEFVLGLNEEMLYAEALEAVGANGNMGGAVSTGIGIDSTTVNSGKSDGFFSTGTGASPAISMGSSYRGFPGLGYHAVNWLELGNTNVTFAGDFGAPGQIQSGLFAMLDG